MDPFTSPTDRMMPFYVSLLCRRGPFGVFLMLTFISMKLLQWNGSYLLVVCCFAICSCHIKSHIASCPHTVQPYLTLLLVRKKSQNSVKLTVRSIFDTNVPIWNPRDAVLSGQWKALLFLKCVSWKWRWFQSGWWQTQRVLGRESCCNATCGATIPSTPSD